MINNFTDIENGTKLAFDRFVNTNELVDWSISALIKNEVLNIEIKSPKRVMTFMFDGSDTTTYAVGFFTINLPIVLEYNK